MEIIKLLVCEACICKEVTEVVATGLRNSTACVYWGRCSRFLHVNGIGLFLHARPAYIRQLDFVPAIGVEVCQCLQ